MSFSVVAHGPATLEAPGFTRAALTAFHATHGASAYSLEERLQALASYETLPPPDLRPGPYWKIDASKLDFSEHYAYHRPEAVTDVAGLPVAWTVLPASERAAIFLQLDSEAVFCEIGARAQAAGVIVSDLPNAKRTHPEIFAQAFHAAVKPGDSKYAALAAAFQSGGAFVYVPDNVRVAEPIVVSYVTDGAALFPHTVVVAGKGAEVTVIENVVSARSDDSAPVIGMTELFAGDGARATYAALQGLPENATHIAIRRAAPGKDATVQFAVAELGAHVVIAQIDSELAAPGGNSDAYGIFFAAGGQHLDLTCNVQHRVGSTYSKTVFKGAARDRGQARFRGNIRISEAAHNAEASLREDALLLSNDAHIDSVPGLEIAANDVKAYHGATVGALDDDNLFYAMTRGIPRAEAEKLIALGFFEPAIEHFPTAVLRDRMRRSIEESIA